MKVDIYKEMREMDMKATILRNSLTKKDKAEIKQAILRYYKFKRSVMWNSQTENSIYLLERNISPELFPQRKGIKFVIITQEKIDELNDSALEVQRFQVD